MVKLQNHIWRLHRNKLHEYQHLDFETETTLKCGKYLTESENFFYIFYHLLINSGPFIKKITKFLVNFHSLATDINLNSHIFEYCAHFLLSLVDGSGNTTVNAVSVHFIRGPITLKYLSKSA